MATNIMKTYAPLSPRVMSFAQWCELNGFSQRNGRRIIELGDGPKVTQLSERRIGIREDHNIEWLNSRIVGQSKKTRKYLRVYQNRRKGKKATVTLGAKS